MAQLLAIVMSGQGSLAAGAPGDGTIRILGTTTAPFPRQALWSFVPVEGDAGLLVNHRDATLLVASSEDGKVTLGRPKFVNDRTALWRMESRPSSRAALVPASAPGYALTAGWPLSDSLSLQAKRDDLVHYQTWYPQPLATGPYVPLPSFDDATIDETVYNLEIVTPGGDPQYKRLFLTVESEQTESVVRIGTDPKISAAQFHLVPLAGGRILSGGHPFVGAGSASEERVYVGAPQATAGFDLRMINLNGSRTFVSGDHVALQSFFVYYVSWKKDAGDLIANARTPRENETFTIEKIDAAGKVIRGEVKPGDSFALLAGNGKHLSDDRGSADRHVTATAPHISAWEMFVLAEPAVRSFEIRSKNTGHPLRLDEQFENVQPLVQRFGYPIDEFEIVDRGDGMCTLRHRLTRSEIAPAPDRPSGKSPSPPEKPVVEAGKRVGIRSGALNTPGIFFRLQAAPPTAWPDAPDLTMEQYRDPAEDVIRFIIGGIVSLAGQGASAATGIPGGAAVFSFAFDQISPATKVSLYDLFSKFRSDILRDVQNLISETSALQASGALQSAREQYLVTYLNARRAHIHGDKDVEPDAKSARDLYVNALNFLSISRDAAGKIKPTDANRATIRAGLPVYAVIVAEYINVLQEIALLLACRPALVLPDVWLKTGGQYVTATPGGGVVSEQTDQPLTKALRVLRRDGSKTLVSGCLVILRSPASTTVPARRAGETLEAKTPWDQIGAAETFSLERVSDPPSVPGQEIKSGDRVALRASNGHYVGTPGGGGPFATSAPRRGERETFTIEMPAAKVSSDPPRAGANEGRRYVDAMQNLRTFAARRYDDARDMFEFLVNDRLAAVSGQNQKHTQKAVDGDLYGYSIFVRDAHYNTELDRRDWPQKWQQQPPPYFNDPANDRLLQAAVDGYRDHLRKVYSFKYRYFHALRPLLSIADETQKLCDQMWSDALMATEYSYVARTTPEHT